MQRPNFTREQEDWICEIIGDWYFTWKNSMTNNREPHSLGRAKEDLKLLLCGYTCPLWKKLWNIEEKEKK